MSAITCGRYAHFVSEPAVVQLAIFFHQAHVAQGEEFARFASETSLSSLLVSRESDSMAAQQGLRMALTPKSRVLDGACDWYWDGGAGGLQVGKVRAAMVGKGSGLGVPTGDSGWFQDLKTGHNCTVHLCCTDMMTT